MNIGDEWWCVIVGSLNVLLWKVLLWSQMLIVGKSVGIGGKSVYGNSLYFPLNFGVNLQVKNSLQKKKTQNRPTGKPNIGVSDKNFEITILFMFKKGEEKIYNFIKLRKWLGHF